MSLIPYGLNPDETWEIDFAADRAKRELAFLAAYATSLREQAGGVKPIASVVVNGVAAQQFDVERVKTELLAQAAELDKKAAALQAELAAYVPRSGPIFTVGAIPNGLRAEIAGEAREKGALPDGTEKVRRDVAWAEKVVRAAIRGHANLISSKSGAPVPFDSEPVDFLGKQRQAPSQRTLEAYQPILQDLALAALESQRLDETRKNG